MNYGAGERTRPAPLLTRMRSHSLWVLVWVAASCAAAEPVEKLEATTCAHQLRLIHDAIQNYRKAHMDLPSSLSDLHPEYLGDPKLFVCPGALRLNKGIKSGPRGLMTSYNYEFTLDTISGLPNRTQRDWKRAQMGLVGGKVPLVRCLGIHPPPPGEPSSRWVLNLSFDGEVYGSRWEWETAFTNLVRAADLQDPVRLLASGIQSRTLLVMPRDARAQAPQLDLTPHYNGSLAVPWVANASGRDLSGLTPGLREFDGVVFDVRGVVQVANNRLLRQGGGLFPDRIDGIAVGQACRRVHFLVGASRPAAKGLEAARLLLRYADGPPQEFAITNGIHVVDTWASPGPTDPLAAASMAWAGTKRGLADNAPTPRLYRAVWENPRPQTRLKEISFVSSLTAADVFVVAITIEP
jgi:hypothetical protein